MTAIAVCPVCGEQAGTQWWSPKCEKASAEQPA